MTTSRKGIGGRKRKGYLEFRGKSWHVQLTITVDGESVRQWFNLETTSKAVARRKAAKLVEQHSIAPTVAAVADEAKRPETFAEVAMRIVKRQGDEGLKTWHERKRRLERYAFEAIGDLEPSAIGPAEIRELLADAGRTGLSKQSVQHLKNDLNAVFGELWRDEVLPQNPVAKVKLPKGLKVDRRPRIVVSDEGFARFMACPDVPEVLQLKAHSSRAFGGMRTSDLHAWDWEHFDLDTWQTAFVYRPKTDGDDETAAVLDELVIPQQLGLQLHAYWTRQGKPKSGPVFPVLKGKRAGERQTKRSHARELRLALWRSGVHQPLEGFEAALAEVVEARQALKAMDGASPGREAYRAGLIRLARAERSAKALDAIQTDSPRSKRADFHSFRRAFNTALGAAGVNVQQAMALAGHKDPRTHMRYVQLAQRGALEMPAAALPLLAPSIPQGLGETQRAANDEAQNQEAPNSLFEASFSLVAAGDPSGNRTRVTGVRDAPECTDPASKQLESSLPGSSVAPGETAGNQIGVRNSWAKLSPWSAVAADAAIRAYLRAAADGIAVALVAG